MFLGTYFLKSLTLFKALEDGFPGGSDSKAFAYNKADLGLYLDREDPLEKETATHSSTLGWKIPQTEEPGRLQSMGPQRVGQETQRQLSDFTFTFHEPLHLPSCQHFDCEHEITNWIQFQNKM